MKLDSRKNTKYVSTTVLMIIAVDFSYSMGNSVEIIDISSHTKKICESNVFSKEITKELIFQWE